MNAHNAIPAGGQGLGGVFRELVWSAMPWAPAPRPHSASAVTRAWLTDVFRERCDAARVEQVTSLDGTTGTTDRRRLGIQWNAAGLAAGLPGSVFVKSTPLSAKNRLMVGPLQMAVSECAFYGSVRGDLGTGVAPSCYAAHAGRGARHLLVLEDLADKQAELFALRDDCDVDHARGMMRALGRLHATFWESPRFSGDLAWLPTQTRRPAIGLLRWQFRRVRRAMLAAPDRELSPATRRMAEFANRHDVALYRQWEKGPLTLLHGDCHLGNTYRLPDGSAGLLDWQVLLRGPGTREVAYFLGSSVPTDVRRAHEDELVRLYLETLTEHGVTGAPTVDQAWEQYRFFLFDVWDSTAITELWPGLQHPENSAKAFARAQAAVTDHDTDQAIRRALA